MNTSQLEWEEVTHPQSGIGFHYSKMAGDEFLILNTIQMTGRLPEAWLRYEGNPDTIEPFGTFSSVFEAKSYCQQFLSSVYSFLGNESMIPKNETIES
jgi:hypothetical protein